MTMLSSSWASLPACSSASAHYLRPIALAIRRPDVQPWDIFGPRRSFIAERDQQHLAALMAVAVAGMMNVSGLSKRIDARCLAWSDTRTRAGNKPSPSLPLPAGQSSRLGRCRHHIFLLSPFYDGFRRTRCGRSYELVAAELASSADHSAVSLFILFGVSGGVSISNCSSPGSFGHPDGGGLAFHTWWYVSAPRRRCGATKQSWGDVLAALKGRRLGACSTASSHHLTDLKFGITTLTETATVVAAVYSCSWPSSSPELKVRRFSIIRRSLPPRTPASSCSLVAALAADHHCRPAGRSLLPKPLMGMNTYCCLAVIMHPPVRRRLVMDLSPIILIPYPNCCRWLLDRDQRGSLQRDLHRMQLSRPELPRRWVPCSAMKPGPLSNDWVVRGVITFLLSYNVIPTSDDL